MLVSHALRVLVTGPSTPCQLPDTVRVPACTACGANNYYCSNGSRHTVSSGHYTTGGDSTTRTGQAGACIAIAVVGLGVCGSPRALCPPPFAFASLELFSKIILDIVLNIDLLGVRWGRGVYEVKLCLAVLSATAQR